MRKNEWRDRLKGSLEIPQIIGNGLLLILCGFMAAMILCLFLFQPKEGEKAEATIYAFEDNSLQYYDEAEGYSQINDNIDTYKASGRPD